jgi:hypothetical protein
MDNVLGCVLMAAISLPVSYLMARACLRGVVRVVTRVDRRGMLSSQS